MSKYQENIVPAANQNKKSVFLYPGAGLKILFVGNSITRHAPKPEIGWNRECGMAASCLEKDYVHQVMKRVRQIDPEAGFCIAQVAPFERDFANPQVLEKYREAAEFEADIIVMFFGANVSKDYDHALEKPVRFGDAYETLRNFLNATGKAHVIHSQGFYIRPVLDAEKEAVAKKYGDIFVSMEEIRQRDDTHGEFNHPSDLGMEEIACAFFREIEPILHTLKAK
ncbi:MAG: SGNH/GDSL hydrolase family protein [Clostridiales bacterium]|nr:SGNH/GDSL hydrolase family protein [Clostridiales bacterium]